MVETRFPTAVVTSGGRLVVPARLRRKFGIKPGTRVRFMERGEEVFLQPVTKKFIWSFRGSLNEEGPTTEDLLRERAADRKREEREPARS